MRKTKIICTLGPAVDNPEILEQLMLAGMDVARINFSHGNYEEQQDRIERVKEVRKKVNKPISLLLDTKGPEIRIGKFVKDMIMLNKGDTFILTNKDILGDETKVSVTYKNLYNEVQIGTKILINDGTIETIVRKIEDQDIICEVINGGKLTNRKSINIPGMNINLPSITQKDIEDIKFGIIAGFDYIAASFVRKPEDVMAIRKILEENNGTHIKIIAKIENREGINNFDKILEVSDGIMVARGDLGVEIPFVEVPPIQKFLITKCRQLGKRVITATEMLESMITNPRPTRAEISDVANAVYDGSSAIMLSGESAAGKYPEETVKVMANIALNTEKHIDYIAFSKSSKFIHKGPTDALSHATCSLANDIKAKCIVVSTLTGTTARMVSRFRSPIPILGITTDEKVYRKLALSWGVTPLISKQYKDTDEMYHEAFKHAILEFELKHGDTVVLTGGEIHGKAGATNTIKLFTVGASN